MVGLCVCEGGVRVALGVGVGVWVRTSRVGVVYWVKCCVVGDWGVVWVGGVLWEGLVGPGSC